MNFELSRQVPVPGFSFINCVRNRELLQSGFQPQNFSKTGTTIVGILFRHGIVLGADTRGTNGMLITEKRSFKIHRITSNIYCCGAGTAGDSENICEMTASQMRLLQLKSTRTVPVVAVVTHIKHILYHHHGDINTAFVIGGIDNSGYHIYAAYPHGSTDKLPYTTQGSGLPCAMSAIETHWYPNMTKLKAVRLARDAVRAGIHNDLASGGCVDICVITKKGAEYTRHVLANPAKCLFLGEHELKKRIAKSAKRKLKQFDISETIAYTEQ